MIKPKFLWKFPILDSAVASNLARDLKLSTTIARTLVNRGIVAKEQAENYLYPSIEKIHSPFQLDDMEKAVGRLISAVKNGEKILIFGDYDVDGISGTALLVSFIRSIDGKVKYYIPNREKEGYGLTTTIIEKTKDTGFTLIITVDTGISSLIEADLCNKYGISLIVLDHHEPHNVLPEAYAIINPKLENSKYPFRELAGVGVAFKFVQAVGEFLKIPTEEILEKYIELVTVGTVGDLVSLMGENRILVNEGLRKLACSKNVGLFSLIEIAHFPAKDKMDTYHIGFGLAPRINAAGRLWNPRAGVELLLSDSSEKAQYLAKKLDGLNKKRILEEAVILKCALEKMEQSPEHKNSRVIVIEDDKWHVGIIGIVASRIIEQYYRPVILLTPSKKTEDISCSALDGIIYQGSARSIAGFDIFSALQQCSDLVIASGGHAMAAGLKIYKNNIPLLRERLNEIADKILVGGSFSHTINVDTSTTFQNIGLKLMEEIRLMSPCGMGNPKPIFFTDNVNVLNVGKCGSDGKHIKMKLGKDNVVLDAVGFGRGTGLNIKDLSSEQLDIVFSLKEDNFTSQRKVVINLIDFKSSNA